MGLYIRLLLLFLLVILLSGLTMILGPASFSFEDFIGIWQSEPANFFISKVLLELRLPRVFAALLTGTALSVAGLSLQSVFRNPLAGPFVLGIDRKSVV